jgi:hypothetical protein
MISVSQDYQPSSISGVSLRHIRYIDIVSVRSWSGALNSFVFYSLEASIKLIVCMR